MNLTAICQQNCPTSSEEDDPPPLDSEHFYVPLGKYFLKAEKPLLPKQNVDYSDIMVKHLLNDKKTDPMYFKIEGGDDSGKIARTFLYQLHN